MTFRATIILLLALPLQALAQQTAARAGNSPVDIRLDWQLVRLENGTRLLMHRDTTMPEVGVEVFIRGGAREEEPSHYGASHLFEHHLPTSGRFLGNPANRAALSRTGRGSGAGTQPDFLRFYLVAKPDGLEPMIGSLADRMESDTTKFLEASLENDKNIVISELRRVFNIDWENEVTTRLNAGTFGGSHPYGHSTSGTEPTVRAATPQLMREWHERFAGGANTIVIVSGNFEPARAEALVRKHFGSITPGRAAAEMKNWVPIPRAVRETIEKEIGSAYIYKSWPVPGFGTRDGELLNLFARVFTDRARPNTFTTAVELFELAGSWRARGQAASPSGLDSVEVILDRTLSQLLKEGPTAAELERARTQLLTDFVARLQAPVWRGGRADVLGQGLLFANDPDSYKEQLTVIQSATPAHVRDAARRWLSEPGYVLRVVPAPKRTASPPIDRAAAIEAVPPVTVDFPTPVSGFTPRATRVLLVERPQLPLAEITLAIRAGASTAEPGVAAAALNAFAESVGNSLAALGATTSAALDADFASITVSLLSARANAAADVLLRAIEQSAAVSQTHLTNGIRDALSAAQQRRASPVQARDLVADCVLAGATDCNTLGTVSNIEPTRVARFMSQQYQPANATLMASGAMTMSTFGAIDTLTQVAPPRVNARAEPRSGESAWVIDFPTATVAHTLLLVRLPPAAAVDPLLAQLVTFGLRQRLMANLRSEKGWSYEVYPFGVQLREGEAHMRYNAPLTLDKLGDGILEIIKEAELLAAQPVTESTLNGWKSYVEGAVLIPGLTSLSQLNRQLIELPRNHLRVDYYAQAQERLRAITPAEFQAAARELLRRDAMAWIVAGPQATVATELREAGMDPTLVR